MNWLIPSMASFVEALIRRKFSSAGLTLQTITVDSDTTVEFWGPPPSPSPDNQEKPALLLLHGFGPTATWQWHKQAQPLSLSFRLYIPNLIFFGGSFSSSAAAAADDQEPPSEAENSRWSEVYQAECMAKLMEKVAVEKFFVAGTSYGGFVAYNMARMWPEKVEKVVIASSAVNMRRRDNEAVLEKAKCCEMAEVMLPSTAEDFRRLSVLASSMNLRYVPDFLLNDFCQKMYADNRKEKLLLLNGLTIGRDDTVNLSRLSHEVLLIWGDQDQIFPLTMANELKEILGEKARLEVIEKASHVPQLENPDEFNHILSSFLSTSSS